MISVYTSAVFCTVVFHEFAFVKIVFHDSFAGMACWSCVVSVAVGGVVGALSLTVPLATIKCK